MHNARGLLETVLTCREWCQVLVFDDSELYHPRDKPGRRSHLFGENT